MPLAESETDRISGGRSSGVAIIAVRISATPPTAHKAHFSPFKTPRSSRIAMIYSPQTDQI
ncbi:hypothetical protein ACVWW5_001290 [Bradyrhizobium sp. LM3.4]